MPPGAVVSLQQTLSEARDALWPLVHGRLHSSDRRMASRRRHAAGRVPQVVQADRGHAESGTDEGTRDDEQSGANWDAKRLSGVIGIRIHDPMEHYTAQQEASMRAAEEA
jgi:uncharacterized glyoxalase superfamily metalloenzyme YdcJ